MTDHFDHNIPDDHPLHAIVDGATPPPAEAAAEPVAPAEAAATAPEPAPEAPPSGLQPATEAETAAGQDDDEAQSLTDVLKSHAREDFSFSLKDITLAKILGGDLLTTAPVRRQVPLILLWVVFFIVYVTCRYQAQKDLIEIDRLQNALVDAKYKALSSSSQLTEKSRESRVLEVMRLTGDSLIHVADRPPFIITIPKK